jgi:hypothetical protein
MKLVRYVDEARELVILVVGLDFNSTEVDSRRHYLPAPIPSIPGKRLLPHLTTARRALRLTN